MPLIESKEASNYTDDGSPQEHCSICVHWTTRGTGETGNCEIVAGVVRAAGWCRHFALQQRVA
jgi:hypothetical protein